MPQGHCGECAWCDDSRCRYFPPAPHTSKFEQATATWPVVDPEKDWCSQFVARPAPPPPEQTIEHSYDPEPHSKHGKHRSGGHDATDKAHRTR